VRHNGATDVLTPQTSTCMQQDSKPDRISSTLPWLLKIQEPSEVERLLEAFAARSGIIAEGSYRVRDPERVPERLRRLLPRHSTHKWVCLSHGTGSWLVTGTIFAGLSQRWNAPVLWLSAYRGDGRLVELGVWIVEQKGTWRRCTSQA
jgi:hypothetical protein